jgi:hypothetical protein
MLEAGRRLGLRRLARDPEGAREGIGPLEASVLGLLGLLVAFTFSGAAGRYDSRRDLVVQEANAIGDAWARLDTLPPETQPPLRDGLRGWMSMAGYAAATAIALYTILDLEFPRLGLIRLDQEDRMLVEVLESMK